MYVGPPSEFISSWASGVTTVATCGGNSSTNRASAASAAATAAPAVTRPPNRPQGS